MRVSHLGLFSKGLVAPHLTHSGSNLDPGISILSSSFIGHVSTFNHLPVLGIKFNLISF